MINPLQSALSAAVNGIRGATTQQAGAAKAIERASLASPDQPGASTTETGVPPEIYAAVTQQLQARGRFQASLEMLKQSDRMLAETIRTL